MTAGVLNGCKRIFYVPESWWGPCQPRPGKRVLGHRGRVVDDLARRIHGPMQTGTRAGAIGQPTRVAAMGHPV